MSRLREGRANTARGAAHFLRETVGRVRYAGANGRLTLRADSGFYTHGVVSVCRKMDVRFSITIRQHKSLHISSRRYPRMPGRRFLTGWTVPRCGRDHLHPLPGRGGRRAGTAHRPAGEADARFPNWPSSPNPAIMASSPTGDGELLELEADHRRHAEIENAIRDLKYGVGLNHLPSGRFAANGAWLAVQTMAHNLARWTARIGLGERIATTKTLRRRFFSLAGRLTRSARRLTLHLPDRWPWAEKFSRALARLRAIPLPA